MGAMWVDRSSMVTIPGDEPTPKDLPRCVHPELSILECGRGTLTVPAAAVANEPTNALTRSSAGHVETTAAAPSIILSPITFQVQSSDMSTDPFSSLRNDPCHADNAV